jgi:hypothetical protein
LGVVLVIETRPRLQGRGGGGQDFISVSVERWIDSLGVDGALGGLRLRFIGGHLPIPAFGVDGA